MGVDAVSDCWPRAAVLHRLPDPLCASRGLSRTVISLPLERTSMSVVRDRSTAPDQDAAEVSERRVDSHV